MSSSESSFSSSFSSALAGAASVASVAAAGAAAANASGFARYSLTWKKVEGRQEESKLTDYLLCTLERVIRHE